MYYGRSEQLQKVKYFNYMGCLINCARHTHEIKSRMVMAKAAFKNNTLFSSKPNLNLRKKLVKCYIWIIACVVLKTGTLRKVDHKYQGSFEM